MTIPASAFVLRRAAAALLFVALAGTSAFVLTHLAPGDAASELFLSGMDADQIARRRADLGLDRPLTEQLAHWATGLAHLDLGSSSLFNRPVGGLVAERAGQTMWLAFVALVVATLVGVPLGILTGARPGGWAAWIVTPLSLALVACPPLVFALGLLLLAVTTHWISAAPGSIVLPALAIALPIAAMLERLQSQATREAIAAPDVLAAAARGVPPMRLLWIHAAKQSLCPVLGVYGIVIGSLFSGSFAVEIVTSWPGLGRLMIDALRGRDLFLVAGCALVGAVCLAAGNFVADVLRAVVDPRVREGA